MKNILSILIIALQSIFVVNAQQYQQGDIEANIFIDGVHDSSSCASFPTSFSNFIVTVSNSFVGDTLLVKQFYPSYLISTEVNTTGQNPWIINLPIMYMNAQGMSTPDGTIEDYYINGGLCPIQTIAYKLINGNDSIDGAYGLTGVAVPNPCSYSSISGATYADYNANCVFDATDGTFINYQVQIANSYNSNYLQFGTNTLFTNNMTLFGQYTVNLQQSYLTSCTVSYNNGMLPFAYPNSCSPGIYTFNTLPQANIDFALQCTSNIDVYAFGGTGPVRPGIPFIFNPHVGNLGCDTISGWVKVVLDNRVTYNASLSSNPPTAIVGDTMYWTHGPISNISNNGFWNGFYSGLHLTPDTTVNIGDTLCFYIATGVALADIHPYNNVRNICVPVVNSYDPNTKEVMPRGIGAAGVIPPTQDELTYTIHFQNTGNASAINVKIVDTLDAHIIPQSLIILGRSHAMTPQWLAPGVVRFNFNNINLPDSNANEPLSHGYVTFIVMLNDTLPLGTEIENKAGIYFDFNAPIITNTTLNTVDILTETKYQTISENISIYPNPAQDQLTLRISNFKNDKNSFVEIYNLSGKLVLSQTIVNSSTFLDLAKFDKGLYILKSNVMGEIHTSKFVVK
jgi:uncharacterized repeat protein (TIGR01451 family)